MEKIYSIKFHPLASGLLVSSSYDLTVRLWNLGSGDEVKVLSGHQDQVGDPVMSQNFILHNFIPIGLPTRRRLIC